MAPTVKMTQRPPVKTGVNRLDPATSEGRFLPYGRQTVTEEDIRSVIEVLHSDWLTQGPTIDRFERRLADAVDAEHAVACASGTAALHLAMLALGIGPGDRIATSPITFMADANCARYVGADVVFVDIDPETACMSPDALADALSADYEHTIKAIVPVNFAGHPADLPEIHKLARMHGASVVSDACHAIGGSYHEGKFEYRLGGSDHADITAFSFHPVKHVAMGEGGALTTSRNDLADRLRVFRNHGIAKDGFVNADMSTAPDGGINPWYHEMQQLGFNYRLSDIHAALGMSQLSRLTRSVARRNQIAARYRRLIAEHFGVGEVVPLTDKPGVTNAYHLFVVQIDFPVFGESRAEVIHQLRGAAIGTQVHYIPIHLQPYYRDLYGTQPGDLPVAEEYYRRALSLPMYPAMTDGDVDRVIERLHAVLTRS